MPLSPSALSSLDALIKLALEEDIGTGDVTTQLLVPESTQAEMVLRAREMLVLAGSEIPERVMHILGGEVEIKTHHRDGKRVEVGAALVTLCGAAQPMLMAERVMLNLMQRMCGVATLTEKYVAAVEGTKAKILDTRKTIPGFRLLDKYAVICGGGINHRMGLYDAVMVKDNHLQIHFDIVALVAEARKETHVPVIVECDTLQQLEAALQASPDRILLDNMPPEILAQAVEMTQGEIPLEASGGVNLKIVGAIARTGVDYISVGALTHSVSAVDIGADLALK